MRMEQGFPLFMLLFAQTLHVVLQRLSGSDAKRQDLPRCPKNKNSQNGAVLSKPLHS